jgi:transcriptional regulator with XRE-family HTH domain
MTLNEYFLEQRKLKKIKLRQMSSLIKDKHGAVLSPSLISRYEKGRCNVSSSNQDILFDMIGDILVPVKKDIIKKFGGVQ